MTNTYGSDPHSDAPHEGEMEAGSENWQGDQPAEMPHDDFGDEHATAETSAVEDTGMEPSAGATETTEKKKSKMLPLLAAIGGLLILGAVVYLQFGRSLMAPATTNITSAMNQPADTNAMAPQLDTAPRTDLTSASSTPPAAQTQGTATPGTTRAAPTPDMPPQLQPTANAAPPTPSAPAPTSVPPLVAAAEQAAAAPAPAMIAPAAVPAPAAPMTTNAPATVASGDAVDARLNALAAHIDEIQKTLDQATQQLGQVGNLVASQASTSGSSIDDRLSKIESQLAQIQQTPALSAPASAPMTAMGAAPAKSAPHTASHSTKHKISHRKIASATSHKSHPHYASTSSSTGGSWVLRAATEDEAWVARDSTSRELRPVHVGDTLPGIGRVTAIQQSGDSWTVKGSQGSVN